MHIKPFVKMKENWKEVTLSDCAEFRKGKGLRKEDLTSRGSHPCIHYGELYTFYGSVISQIKSFTNNPPPDPVLSEGGEVLLPASDVTPDGLAIASYLKTGGVILGGDILVVKPNPHTIKGELLPFLIRGMKEEVIRLVTGTTVCHLNSKNLGSLSFKIPPTLQEQEEIVKLVAGIYHSKELVVNKLSRKIEKIDNSCKGAIRELLFE